MLVMYNVATCTNYMYKLHVHVHTCISVHMVKPPLVDSPNKGHFQLSGQHDMHGLNFSIQINLSTKDTPI